MARVAFVALIVAAATITVAACAVSHGPADGAAIHCGTDGDACASSDACCSGVCSSGHCGIVPCAPPTERFVWARSLGGPGEDVGQSLAADDAGDVFVTGTFADTVDFGGGPLSTGAAHAAYVARYTNDGTHVWSHSFGGPGLAQGNALSVDAAGNIVLVAGGFTDSVDFGSGALTSAGGDSDAFLAGYRGADGTSIWARAYGSMGAEYGTAVAVRPTGDLLFGAAFEDTIDFGGGPLTSAGWSDVALCGDAPDGEHLWSRRAGGVRQDSVYDAAVDPRGGWVVSGAFDDDIDLGGDTFHSAGNSDGYVAEYTVGGEHVWSRQLAGPGWDHLTGVATGPTGDAFVTGTFAGTAELAGARLTSAGLNDVVVARVAGGDGTLIWSRQLGGVGDDLGESVAVSPDGAYLVVAGYLGGDVPDRDLTARDAFVAAYSADGAFLWSRTFGGTSDDVAFDVAYAECRVVVTGSFAGTADLDGHVLVSAGGHDAFLAGMGP